MHQHEVVQARIGGRSDRLVRLGWKDYAILSAGLTAIVVVVFLFSPLAWHDIYVQRFAIKTFENQYGFETGSVNIRKPDGTVAREWGIVSVTPDGEFARLGVEAGDIPFEHHGHSASALNDALMMAASGQPASFDVINSRNWFKEWTLREIQVPARHP